ncbi:hypothetical protein G5B31_07440 [Rhodobacter sp. SGA-6-6]|uniref:hypothetical protein n=1 Tax=Rhodobacter sp. SGA-6-6 TaxID=2710882 RepID=UPI0013ED20AC|nr:hypothetical protein [Rhodobacter sp. SGA-6-6]NGM45367.1 hypothetical protein [Rhodobacter sp. SGA-6-6]
MKRLILALALCAPLAAAAEEPPKPGQPQDSGTSLMEEGARLLLRGLMTEMEPALDGMAKALEEAKPWLEDLGPQLTELVRLMGDIRNYEMPVMLPNGDILIRRRLDAPPLTPEGPQLPGPNGEIEL